MPVFKNKLDFANMIWNTKNDEDVIEFYVVGVQETIGRAIDLNETYLIDLSTYSEERTITITNKQDGKIYFETQINQSLDSAVLLNRLEEFLDDCGFSSQNGIYVMPHKNRIS